MSTKGVELTSDGLCEELHRPHGSVHLPVDEPRRWRAVRGRMLGDALVLREHIRESSLCSRQSLSTSENEPQLDRVEARGGTVDRGLTNVTSSAIKVGALVLH